MAIGYTILKKTWIYAALVGCMNAMPCLAIGQAEVAEKPNVLFIISDDLGARLACYGEPAVNSPNLDRLAKQGTLFERCYTQRPTCGPSRNSMLSGLYNHETGMMSMHARMRDSKIPLKTLPHLFRKNGYYTARVGKVYHMGVPNDIGTPGVDDPKSWDMAVNNDGWDGYSNVENLKRVKRHPGPWKGWGVAVTYLDPDIADEQMVDGNGTQEAIRILESHHPEKTGKPLMLFMGYFRPHPPMIAPRKHWDAIDRDAIQLPDVPEDDRETFPKGAIPLQGFGHNYLPDDVGRDYAHAYYASIHFIDSEIGKLINALKVNGLDDNTIIVVTGDQGFHLGEHHHWHKTTAFEPSFHVPLIIVDPRIQSKGQRANGICGLIDIYPTLCDLAGIKPEHQLSGTSLKPRLQDASQPGKEWELTQLQNGVSLRTERFRYTRLNDGTMLYDLHEDPHEWRNLAGFSEYADIEASLDSQLAAIMNSKTHEAVQ